MGRTATGVKGVSMDSENDIVVGMVCVSDKNKSLLVVSEKGYAKRSEIDEYRITSRGTKGVKTMNITDKTGLLVAIQDVTDFDQLMIINKSGIIIRMDVDELRVMGRNTQGVRAIKLSDTDEISSVAKIEISEEMRIAEAAEREAEELAAAEAATLAAENATDEASETENNSEEGQPNPETTV
jgi:DNA gyrase subunit A